MISTEYLGSNAFGVKANVKETVYEKYSLKISNEKIIAKALNNETNSHLPKIAIKMDPSNAKRNMEKFRLLYVCRLTPFIDCRFENKNRCQNTKIDLSGSNPTISDPYGDHTFESIISVYLLEVIVYIESSGEIIERFGPF